MKNRKVFLIILVLINVVVLASCSRDRSSAVDPESFDGDPRAYQHGVDFLRRSDGNYILIWASSGLPPVGADADGEWSHDVYYSMIDSARPFIDPAKIISAPGAQEPASSAMSSDGHVMITMEDAYQAQNNIAQTYAVYDENMNPIKEYQNMVLDGGHSGHVAAVGDKFVVFYSDEWVDGGGVDNLGSGDDVWLKVFDSNGYLLNEKGVAVGDATRDWWPMIAGSEHHALLLWQRFVENESYATLVFNVFDPATNRWVKGTTEIVPSLEYYTYDVQYISSLDLFLIGGSDDDGDGFAFLISTDGDTIAQNTSLPPMVREAQPAVWQAGHDRARVVYAVNPGGLMVLTISSAEIVLEDRLSTDDEWSTSGTDGIFLSENIAYFVSLSPEGITELTVDLE